MAKVPIQIRPARPEDRAFVQKSWLKSYEASDFAKSIKPTIYLDRHRAVTNRLIGDQSVHVLVATPVDDDFTILAFAVVEHPDIVHYVHVKPTFRGFGIARDLLAPVGRRFRYSHRTLSGEVLLRHLDVRASYDPYAAFKASP